MRWRWVWLALAAWGCDEDGAATPTIDAAADARGAARDVGVTLDGASLDAAPDAAPDMALPDATPDMALPDAAPDMALLDAAPDMILPDPLRPAAKISSAHFATAQVCADCHSNSLNAQAMRDEDRNPISPFNLWQASMMANASRDPYWRAQVSVETQQTQAAAAVIEAKCTRCHAPLAHVEDDPGGEMDMIQLDEDTPRGAIGRDGVSCTVCHLIQPENLGEEASFSGGFELGLDKVLNAPHQGSQFEAPMIGFTGFSTRYAPHMHEADLCAPCHTLSTATLSAEAEATGELFHEQTPYLEWRNSEFGPEGAAETTCQGCHMPRDSEGGAPLSTAVARSPMGSDYAISPRSPYGRHLFIGGNTLIPAILKDNASALRPLATSAAFNALIERVIEQLSTRTATLSLSEARVEGGGVLRFEAQVINLTGHKLPTGYPSRRLWLHIQALDAHGAVLFESGGVDEAGRILDGQGAPLASERAGGPTQPHRDQIAGADEVVIWETVNADTAGAPTFVLLRAARFLKDNRLLPRGWRADHEDIGFIAPVGVEGDTDFSGGGDVIHIAAPVMGEVARVRVELLYQTLSARWAAELFAFETPQVAAFKRYYEAAPRGPVVVASAEMTLP
ncbi:cytochrome c family protein [Myxococcota bacterium]|nr:cytochrome c family protein [Myxococcota bacterium]MBU1897593.1 cytochrome c family protein [Myxococcota bacterium]